MGQHVATVKFTDGVWRPVYERPDGRQYVDVDGLPIYGTWCSRATSCSPMWLRAARHGPDTGLTRFSARAAYHCDNELTPVDTRGQGFLGVSRAARKCNTPPFCGVLVLPVAL
jgi:hypothetical protein